MLKTGNHTHTPGPGNGDSTAAVGTPVTQTYYVGELVPNCENLWLYPMEGTSPEDAARNEAAECDDGIYTDPQAYLVAEVQPCPLREGDMLVLTTHIVQAVVNYQVTSASYSTLDEALRALTQEVSRG